MALLTLKVSLANMEFAKKQVDHTKINDFILFVILVISPKIME